MIDSLLSCALRTVAHSAPLLVASDFDGVLSPIVDNPAEARPDPRALEALVRLGDMPDTHAVAISGRSLAALTDLTGAPAGVTLIGTHGAEEDGSPVATESAERVAALQLSLAALAEQFPGSVVEDKPIGAAFHYRHAARPSEAADAARTIAAAAGARTISGKMVVECLYGTTNKGHAVERTINALGIASTVYLGDDTTDEHAFAVLGTGDVGIKIGPGDTCASHRVDAQTDVVEALELLAETRAAFLDT